MHRAISSPLPLPRAWLRLHSAMWILMPCRRCSGVLGRTTATGAPYQATPTSLRNTGSVQRKVGPHHSPIQWPQQRPYTWTQLESWPPPWSLSPSTTWLSILISPILAWVPTTCTDPDPDPWPWRRRSRLYLLGAPSLCQRTGRGLGLIPRVREGALTSSKLIPPCVFWVPSSPIFLVALFHQFLLSCITLPHHTSLHSTWKPFLIFLCLKIISCSSP